MPAAIIPPNDSAIPDEALTPGPVTLVTLPADPVEAGATAERARLARELHDTVIQSLVGIGVQVEQAQAALAGGAPARAAQELIVLREMVAYGLEEARRTILGLRPLALTDHDLVGALAAEVARQVGSSGLRHQFSVSGRPVVLPSAVEEGLLRITQEALGNVRRHATASSVQVRLVFDAPTGRVCLTVEDDGQGFDRRNPLAGRMLAAPADPDAPALSGHYVVERSADSESYVLDLAGYGLLGMQERARLLGGELRVSSGRGVGTIVEVEVPYAGGLAPVPAAPFPLPVLGSAPRVRVDEQRTVPGLGECEREVRRDERLAVTLFRTRHTAHQRLIRRVGVLQAKSDAAE